MKAVLGVLGVFALLGVVYGLAFMGIIPVQKMAAHSPALASVLTKLHLAKGKKPRPAPMQAAAVSPEQRAIDAQKKKLAADQARLEKDRTAFAAQKQAVPAPADGGSPAAPADNAAKLAAIYATMSADDLVGIFGKLPDPDVIQALTMLDEKKAGQVLAALPSDRAARLSRVMAHAAPKLQAAL